MLTEKKRRLLAGLGVLLLPFGAAAAEEYAGTLVIEDGMAQPMLAYSNFFEEDYSNEDSDILRFTVYVETDYDTDKDGMDDLVKVFLQVPRAAVEGQYQAGVIYDPTPYMTGTIDTAFDDPAAFYTEQRFNYAELYQHGEKRTPEEQISTMEHALTQDQSEWNYTVPVIGAQGYSYAQTYDYYLVRGFAVAESGGLGTFGSEGFELCGFDLERDAHKNVVEWLAGSRRAFTDPGGTTEIAADWSNGKIAMTGTSYGGTLPYEVATTGVEGLETIIPYAGIASWYDYTNSQGVAKQYAVHYADMLAGFNAGGQLIGQDELVAPEDYGAWLYTVSQDEEASNGNYTDIWAQTDYSDDFENIRCSALVVHGLNDFNVTTRQADLMAQAFQRAGQKCTLVFHQDGHNYLYSQMLNDSLWDEIMNEWLCHYLYGTENGIENLPAVIAQSNLDGTYQAYDSWRAFSYAQAEAEYEAPQTSLSTYGFMDYVNEFTSTEAAEDGLNQFYLTIPEENAAYYALEIPEGMTIYGVPKISFRASTTKAGFEGLMISAVLVDCIDGETEFPAYVTKRELDDILPVEEVGYYDVGGGYGTAAAKEFAMSSTPAKSITFGWTDLASPGGGEKSSDYKESTVLEAGKAYDYTFYMMPTVYTVAPGHRLVLVIYTWDPYTNAFLDDSSESDDEQAVEYYNYDLTIDNASLVVEFPEEPESTQFTGI